MRALLEKFYLPPIDELIKALKIHQEFEYFFSKAGRFQNIHVDFPPKLLSFVFYIPENEMNTLKDEEDNATILYDSNLMPHRRALFRENSVCVFAPHFGSYHGFDSTRDRDVLVMFYVHPDLMKLWSLEDRPPDEPPFHSVRDSIQDKFTRFPLIEYGPDTARLEAERAACRINAPSGRVLR